jgi:hypothetical protein
VGSGRLRGIRELRGRRAARRRLPSRAPFARDESFRAVEDVAHEARQLLGRERLGQELDQRLGDVVVLGEVLFGILALVAGRTPGGVGPRGFGAALDLVGGRGDAFAQRQALAQAGLDFLGVARGDQDRRVRPALLHLVHDLEAAALRHDRVGDHEVDAVVPLDLPQRIVPARCREHLVAETGQHREHEVAQRLGILGDDDALATAGAGPVLLRRLERELLVIEIHGIAHRFLRGAVLGWGGPARVRDFRTRPAIEQGQPRQEAPCRSPAAP